MFYENDLMTSINNNDFNKFKFLIEEKNVNPFCFGMDYIELCIKKNKKNFIQFALNFTDKYHFDPIMFLKKVNEKEYNDIIFEILEKYKDEINYQYDSEIIIKNIMNKNEKLLLYIVKEMNASLYPFLNGNDMILNLLVEFDMYETLKLIIKDININEELINIAVLGYAYNSYKLLKDKTKLKINYIKLLKSYFYSDLKETEYSLKIINDIMSNISNIEAIKNIETKRLYFYNRKKDEKNKAFKLLIDYALKNKESYVYLNDLFENQALNNNKENVKYLLTKSDLLIQEINKISFKDNIKILLKMEKEIKYLYTYESLCILLKQEAEREDLILEIFKDKNLSKFLKINKFLKNVKNKRLRSLLQINLNISNF